MKNKAFIIFAALFCLLGSVKTYSQTDSSSSGHKVLVDGKEEVIDLMVVEQFPVYPGCESAGDNDAAFNCFNQQISLFLSQTINYPEQAIKKKKEGLILVNFTIGRTGEVKDVRLADTSKVIGFGLEEEALRVIGLLPRMKPATQRGKAVAVSYRLPIRFALR